MWIVVAHCYQGPDNYTIVPSCPYCFCTHRHRVPGLVPLSERHVNGSLIPYHDGLATKISECLGPGRTYALELRAVSDIPLETQPLCRGRNKKGRPCTKRAKKGYCVCTFHYKQMPTILADRYTNIIASVVALDASVNVNNQ